MEDKKEYQSRIVRAKKPQRIQLDNNIPIDENLDYKDVLLYAMLLSYADKDTFQTFVSLEKLSEEINMSKNTISTRLKKLQENGNIEIGKKGKSNLYTLKKPPKSLKDKEEFTMEFIRNKNYTGSEKALFLCIQNKMEKDPNTGFGELKLTTNKISKIMGCSPHVTKKIIDGLEGKEILSKRDNKSFIFDLNKVGQAVLFLAVQVQENTEDIVKIKKELKDKNNKINTLEARVEYLEKQLKKDNFEDINYEEVND